MKAALAALDPAHAPEVLAASRAPFLIGVRHHSAALSAAMPAMLDAFAPTVVLLELPADLEGWLEWLGAPDLEAPVALSATAPDGGLSFYPFADFSPELAAIRWARRAGVPVLAIDRPVGARTIAEAPETGGRLLARLQRDDEDLWDTLVEARAPADPEALRRAALSFGWLHRADTLLAGRISTEDATREGHMRGHVERAVAKKGARVCAIVGAFHANALLAVPILETPPAVPSLEPLPATGALVPYDFELLDARSGYPAGILDPSLVQRSWELFGRGEALDAVLPELLVAIGHALRAKGHVASFADLREAARLAGDLATLRGLRSAGRRELLEAITTTMSHGEPLGRGRVLARALETVLVGQRRGRLAADTPRSGLGVATEVLLDELGLPGPQAKESKELTLDPQRSPLDRRRAILLGQLEVCGVPYAERRGGGLDGARAKVESITLRVRVQYTSTTAARIELAGIFGTTPRAAAEGVLHRDLARLRTRDEAPATGWLVLATHAAAAGLDGLVDELLGALDELVVPTASIPVLADALALVARLDDGQVATLAPRRSLAPERERLVFATLRALDGIVGSTLDADVVAFGELLALLADRDLASLALAIDDFATTGSPLMQGAGTAARVLIGREPVERFATAFASWLDHGGDDTAAAAWRAGVLRGALLLAGPIFEGDPRFTVAVLDGIDRLDDDRFLARLPSLRDGFDVLSAADRQRLLDELGLPLRSLDLTLDPAILEALARGDEAARRELAALGLAFASAPLPASAPLAARPTRAHRIGLHDRLRLLLGREMDACPPAIARYGLALDALYGHGHGEGSRGGTDSAFPTARAWGDELGALFGAHVREEVLGRAAQAGDAAVLSLLDADEVVPSVELLEQILSLKGGLAEGDLEHLRRLARRVIDRVIAELAVRMQPMLSGLATPRPTRRRGGPLDLRRTVKQNLGTAHEVDGTLRLAPREFSFRTRAGKSLDWRIVLVVDVSGSMDTSVVHAAMMAAILGGLPAVTTHFVAVNDKVVDLSDHVADPLELLLSVRIGGGTILGKGLRYARDLVRVPSRTLVFLVSDFEEGGSVRDLLAEVRALVESGATVLGLAALGENHAPRYNQAIAGQLVDAGMPVAALGPIELARWVGEHVRGAR